MAQQVNGPIDFGVWGSVVLNLAYGNLAREIWLEAKLDAGALDHAMVAHASAEAGHRALLAELGLKPLLDLGMRLGEGSGAAVAVLVLRAALACHTGMATFGEAGVAEKSTE